MRVRLAFSCLLAMAGCGHSEPARSVDSEPTSPTGSPVTGAGERGEPRGASARAAAPEIEVEGEVGGLDADAVDRVVQSAARDVDRCWSQGVERNELMSGSIRLELGIGANGRAAWGFVKQSTLGDAGMERCILKALSTRAYPKPVGGKVGVVRSVFSFDLDAPRPPASWASTRVGEVVGGLASEIAACKRGSSATFSVTAYVRQVELPPPPVEEGDAGDAGDDASDDAVEAGPTYVGKVISVGIAAPDEKSFASAECLERVLSQADFPPPGDWPVKVTFEL